MQKIADDTCVRIDLQYVKFPTFVHYWYLSVLLWSYNSFQLTIYDECVPLKTAARRYFVPVSGPFDLIKTRLMAQEKHGQIKYRGLLHALVTIPREEGFFTMWRGLLPRLLRIPPGEEIMLRHLHPQVPL